MGWISWPPSNGDSVTSWDFWSQIPLALRERHAVLNNSWQWPPPGVVWTSGVIDSVTDNGDGTFNANITSNGDWDLKCTGAVQRWVGYVCSGCGLGYLPPSYDLIIELDRNDPFKFVRGHITTETYTGPAPAAGVLKLSGASGYQNNIADAITAKFIPDLASLAGANYYILKAGAPWVSDRLIDKPNEREQWRGSASAGSTGPWPGAASGDTTVYMIITDTSTAPPNPQLIWTQDHYVDFEVLIYGDDGNLHRETILHNSGSRNGTGAGLLYIAQTAYVPGGIYTIIPAGAKGIPGRDGWRRRQWYAGYALGAPTHLPDDTVGSWPFAQQDAIWADGDPCTIPSSCADTSHNAFDIDVQVPFDSGCTPGRAGDYLAPGYWKTIRSWQNDVVNLSPSFVEKKSYDGATAIPSFTPATFFNSLGINSGTSALSYVSGTSFTFSVGSTSPYIGRLIFWTVLNADGSVEGSGTSTPNGSGLVSVTAAHPADDGKTVIYSAGWTRFEPRHFQYLFPKTNFIPDTGGTPLGPIDPPVAGLTDPPDGTYDCVGVGTWIRREKSNGYAVYAGRGKPGEGDAFVTGEYARYMGDSAGDPSITGGPLLLAPYWDRFFRGTYKDQNQKERNNSKVGTLTAGGLGWLADGLKHWWTDTPANGGILRIESGTATGGNTTSLSDSLKDTTNHTLEYGCWWAVTRFVGSGFMIGTGSSALVNPYKGFILEVDKNYSGSVLTVDGTDDKKVTNFSRPFVYSDIGMTLVVTGGGGWLPGSYKILNVVSGTAILDSSPAPVSFTSGIWTLTTTYKRVITSSSIGAGGITVNFTAVDDLAVANTDVYRIYEPKYELDKWEGRLVQIMRSDKTKFFRTAQHNDDGTIFFDPAETNPMDQSSSLPNPTVPQPGWTYTIREPGFGSVWRWDGSKFVDPGGEDDAVRLGVLVPKKFQRSEDGGITPNTRNLESHVKRYGAMIRMDAITLELMVELFNSINALVWTLKDFDWTSNGETNTGGVVDTSSFHYGSVTPDYASFSAAVAAMITDNAVQLAASAAEHDGWVPSKSYNFNASDLIVYPDTSTDQGNVSNGGGNVYGYAKASGIPTIMNSTFCSFVYGSIDSGDSPEADATTHTTDSSDPSFIIELYDRTKTHFDAAGDAIAYHVYTQFSTATGNTAIRTSIAALGDMTTNFGGYTNPNAMTPMVPGEVSSTVEEQIGWYALRKAGILKWDVAGGMLFIAP